VPRLVILVSAVFCFILRTNKHTHTHTHTELHTDAANHFTSATVVGASNGHIYRLLNVVHGANTDKDFLLLIGKEVSNTYDDSSQDGRRSSPEAVVVSAHIASVEQ